MNSKLVLYTAQTEIVFESLEKTGEYFVKKEYIEKKYGEVAFIMLHAYDWFVSIFKEKVFKPETGEYPVWLFSDPKYAKVSSLQKVIKLEIPKDEVILFDNRGWERILSCSYVGIDRSDEDKFDNKMRLQGIDCGFTAFEKPFYPQIKSEIKNSWNRIFDIDKDNVLRGATWMLKKEWIVE